MKSLEFTYWLQGAFELIEVKKLDAEQTQIIKNHLNMVQYHEKNDMSAFCTWLKGFFEMCEPLEINEDQTKKIREKLNGLFNHVVKTLPVLPPVDYSLHTPRSGMQLNPLETSQMINC